jgi:phage shock protein A
MDAKYHIEEYKQMYSEAVDQIAQDELRLKELEKKIDTYRSRVDELETKSREIKKPSDFNTAIKLLDSE